MNITTWRVFVYLGGASAVALAAPNWKKNAARLWIIWGGVERFRARFWITYPSFNEVSVHFQSLRMSWKANFGQPQRCLGRDKMSASWCLSSCSIVFVYSDRNGTANYLSWWFWGSQGVARDPSAEPFLSSLAFSGALGALYCSFECCKHVFGECVQRVSNSMASYEIRLLIFFIFLKSVGSHVWGSGAARRLVLAWSERILRNIPRTEGFVSFWGCLRWNCLAVYFLVCLWFKGFFNWSCMLGPGGRRLHNGSFSDVNELLEWLWRAGALHDRLVTICGCKYTIAYSQDVARLSHARCHRRANSGIGCSKQLQIGLFGATSLVDPCPFILEAYLCLVRSGSHIILCILPESSFMRNALKGGGGIRTLGL